VEVFDRADYTIIAPVNRPDKVPAEELFSCEQLVIDLQQKGKTAVHLKSTNEIINYLIKFLRPGDKVITFSNGPFDNIHDKLIDAIIKKNK